VERVRGPARYLKYRLPDWRQVQKKPGPAWTGRGRPPAGFFTERTAESALRDVLDEVRRGTLPGMVRSVPMATDLASVLAQLGRREHRVGKGDPVFVGATGSYLDGSGLRPQFKEALVPAGLWSLAVS
jgi:hypothetical protein